MTNNLSAQKIATLRGTSLAMTRKIMFEKELQSAGLNESEAKVYLALLDLGEATVLPISKNSGVHRTYCYDILENLREKGLVSHVEKRGRRHYFAADPSVIKDQIQENERRFQNILPDLVNLYLKPANRPKMRFFEGKRAVRTIYEEITREAKEAWFVGSVKGLLREFPGSTNLIKEQVRRGVKIRDLVLRETEVKEYRHLYTSPLQQIRYLPEGIKFTTDNLIWENKVAMISYGDNLHGVVIESKEIAETMREFHGILWHMSKSI